MNLIEIPLVKQEEVRRRDENAVKSEIPQGGNSDKVLVVTKEGGEVAKMVPDPIAEIERFLSDFQKLTESLDPKTEIQQFVDGFVKLAEKDLPVQAKLDMGILEELLEEFQTNFDRYTAQAAEAPPSINIWEVAHFGRDEVQHCRFLTWLLDPWERHGQGARFFRCFLSEVAPDRIHLARQRFWVKREEVTAEGHGRIDIRVEGEKFICCVEAKIDSRECDGQLKKYWDGERTRSVFRNIEFIGIYLTRAGRAGPSMEEKFTHITWRQIERALRKFGGNEEHALDLRARCPFVRELAYQYAAYLRSIQEK